MNAPARGTAAASRARGGDGHGGLELRGLRKAYGSLRAVRDVSLRIESGEFVSFLGPSGSGKTTTLMLIAGFATPDAGRIVLDGADITGLPPHRRTLGMVYQNYALFPHLSVERNVSFPLEMRGIGRAEVRRRVNDALDLVQLAEKSTQLPRQLSGGQQQRVALARALVFEPPVLLMDEPLGALDRKLRGEMQAEIKRIQRRLGITTIYVTHDQDEALTMSDRVVVLRGGQIEQAASPTELYDRPASAFVAEFIGAANLFSATVTDAGPPALARTPGGLVFEIPRAAVSVGQSICVVLRPERISLTRTAAASMHGHGGTIEDVSFAGGLWRYGFALTTGERILITESNRGAAALGPGDAAHATWAPDDVWVVPNTCKEVETDE